MSRVVNLVTRHSWIVSDSVKIQRDAALKNRGYQIEGLEEGNHVRQAKKCLVVR